jgi:hypothetical protein
VRGDVVCRVREDWLEDCSQSDGSQTFVAECSPHQVSSHQGVTCTCSYCSSDNLKHNSSKPLQSLKNLFQCWQWIDDILVSKGSAVSMIEWRLATRQG